MKSAYYKRTTIIVKVSLCTLLLIISFPVLAQRESSNNLSKTNIYVDAGGHFAGQFSLNLETQIYSGNNTTWYLRGGVGGAGIIMANGGLGGLGALTLLTSKTAKHFELNIGTFVGHDNEQNKEFIYPLLDLGYRYQKPEGGFLFKAKLGVLGLGIGLGYAF